DKGGDVHVGTADLDRAVRVAPDPARKIVCASEFERAHVARRCDLACVEDLHDVQPWRDPLEHRSAEMPASVSTEGMGDVGEPALLVTEVDAVLGGPSRRRLLL